MELRDDPVTWEFTQERLKRLKKKYAENDGNTFMFEGVELYRDYAGYLIEYLETIFPNNSEVK